MRREHPTAALLLAALLAPAFLSVSYAADTPAPAKPKAPGLGDPGKLTAIAVDTGRLKDGLVTISGRDSGQQIVAAGTPDLSGGVSTMHGIVLEAVLTFFLVFVVYGTAVYAHAPKIGGLAIGLTVALDILAGGPITGAAMNPARTFGPALASSHWNNHIVYWIGPMLGGALAGLIYGRFLIKEAK